MRFKFKIPLLLAVLAVSVMGVSAASASAAEFLLKSGAMENVEVKASALSLQGFEISGAVSVCKKGKFKTVADVLAPAATLLVHPTYTECEAKVASTHNALVLTTGCNYVFHAAAPNTLNGKVDVECETGNEILVDVETLNCKIKVGSQTSLGKVEYRNLTGGKIEVRAEVEGIAYTTNCAGIPSSGTTGKYKEGVLPVSLGAGPATALAEAISESSKLFVESMVE